MKRPFTSYPVPRTSHPICRSKRPSVCSDPTTATSDRLLSHASRVRQLSRRSDVAVTSIREQRYARLDVGRLGASDQQACGVNGREELEESLNRVTRILLTEKPHMRYNQRPRLLNLLLTLWLSTALCTPSLAVDMAFLSIGPRIGFGEKTPLLGREQHHHFHLTDVAAVFTLPLSWPLGGSAWSLETRLIASASLPTAAGHSGLMMTVVPHLALSGREGLVTCDAGAGQDSSATTSSACRTSGGRFNSFRPWGVASIHFLTHISDIVSNTSSISACTDRPLSAWTCTSKNLATRSNSAVAGLAIPSDVNNQAQPTALWLPP